MTSPIKRTRALRPGRFAREASARRFVSRLDRLGFGTYASLQSWMCKNGYGHASDAPPIGSFSDSNRTPIGRAAYRAAVAQSNPRVLARLSSGQNLGLPIEELEAELGGDFLQKLGDVEVLQDADDRTSGGALDKVEAEFSAFETFSLL